MHSIVVTTVICPHCHAELEAHCETCSRCQRSLRIDRTRRASRHATEENRWQILNRPWVLVVLLLHVGLLGIPAYWKTHYSVGTRVAICLLSVAYTIFAVGFIIVVGGYVLHAFTRGW